MFSIETKFRLKNLYRSVRRVVEIVGNVILFPVWFPDTGRVRGYDVSRLQVDVQDILRVGNITVRA